MPASSYVYQGEDDEWYFNVKGGNGEIVVQSEGYTTKQDAQRGLRTAIECVLEVAAQAVMTSMEAEEIVYRMSTGEPSETPSE